MTDPRLHEDKPPIESVRAIFNDVSLSSHRHLTLARRFPESWGAQQMRQRSAYLSGFDKVWQLVEQAVLRERAACAEAVAPFSPAAAGAILSRPRPEKWKE